MLHPSCWMGQFMTTITILKRVTETGSWSIRTVADDFCDRPVINMPIRCFVSFICVVISVCGLVNLLIVAKCVLRFLKKIIMNHFWGGLFYGRFNFSVT